MARPTYRARVLVIRKTKLGETDLILTMLAEDGSQLRAVAKGARKPSGAFASRLELFCEADVLLVRGKSLDIVKEARLICGNAQVRESLERASAASVMVELLDRATQPDLPSPKLFPMTHAALAALAAANVAHAPAICAAHLLKTFAFAGVRPTLAECSLCGEPLAAGGGRAVAAGEERSAAGGSAGATGVASGLAAGGQPAGESTGAADTASDAAASGRGSAATGRHAAPGLVAFSVSEGGALCDACATTDSIRVSAATLAWARALLSSRFSDIVAMEINQAAIFDVLRLCQTWGQVHLSAHLRSLTFLFTCGLF